MAQAMPRAQGHLPMFCTIDSTRLHCFPCPIIYVLYVKQAGDLLHVKHKGRQEGVCSSSETQQKECCLHENGLFQHQFLLQHHSLALEHKKIVQAALAAEA
jgi:hypothetical protein